MDGLNSLLDEMTLPFKRGERVKYIDRFGKVKAGRFVMASSMPGHIVLNVGGAHGRPAVVSVESVTH